MDDKPGISGYLWGLLLMLVWGMVIGLAIGKWVL